MGDPLPIEVAVNTRPTKKNAAAVLIERDHKFLLVQEAEGHWMLPGGGLEFGETFMQAAKRETFEETSLELPYLQYIGGRDLKNVFVQYFLCTQAEGEARVSAAEKDGILKAEWKSAQQVIELARQPIFPPIQDYLQYVMKMEASIGQPS